ncbi:hypothetical protein HNQ46_001006 [Oribacterium sinus]|jgi:hypothetical protein|uniref:Uncharacterized protein n=1 Tax=Oribacterium sinus TaxID=237576 RepID=A0A7W9SFA6_9FIRM|nr:hypothetical protein [Oribacterium sinus]MBB6041034.1 hypothetical protein [Oribacterium sinus]
MTKEEIWEMTLPRYLRNDIKAYVQGIKENSSLLDCLWGEVYGSINSALYSYEISDEQARFLRNKYLGIGLEDE